MKGVHKDGVHKNGLDKGVSKKIGPENYVAIHRRIDQSLPMETAEWHKLEQLLMQITEFAPTTLVYQIGMAAAVYADNQAQRAYLLGREDAGKRFEKEPEKLSEKFSDKSKNKSTKSIKPVKAVKANKSVA